MYQAWRIGNSVAFIYLRLYSHHTRQFFVPTRKALQFSTVWTPIWYGTLQFRDQRGAASFCYKNHSTYVRTEAMYLQYGCFAGAKAIHYRVNIALSFRKKTNNWASTVAGVLSSGCPQFFKSGQKEFNKETGWWALQENVAPAVKFNEQGLFLLYLFISIFLN